MSESSFTESAAPYISKPGDVIGTVEVTVTRRETVDTVIAERDQLRLKVVELNALVQRLEAELAEARQ